MKTETIKLNVRPLYKCGKGHSAHRSGAGVHLDRRNRRNRTRSSQLQRAMKE